MPEEVTKTILVVEDDRWIRELLVELLQDEGYDVAQAQTGAEALQRAREQRPDLIVLDLRLPDTSGLDVLQALRAEPATSSLPVLVISGYLDRLTQATLQRREQRANGVIPKPLDLADFFREVERALRAGTGGRFD